MKYNIEKTADLDFNPTELDVIVGEKIIKEDETEWIGVTTILTHRTDKSQTQRATQHEFPLATWNSIVTGYDTVKKEPILNTTMLGSILTTFNLKLV